MKDLQTASWDNSNIYKNFQDPQIARDLETIEERTKVFQSKSALYNNLVTQLENNITTDLYNEMELTKQLTRLYLDTDVVFYNLAIYASMANSVNALNYEAKAQLDKVMMLSNEFMKAIKPLQLCVQRSPADFFMAFLDDERTKELTFKLTQSRKQLENLLSVNEEVLLTGFSMDGLNAWGKLYSDISGSMKVEIDGKVLGLATAKNLASHEDRTTREKAYRAVNKSWQQQEISACAILNSINGWRNENFKVRSTKKELHYLDQTCLSASITRETLQALMSTTYDKRSVGQESLNLMAKELKIDRLGPWDVMAPMPSTTTVPSKISYPEAIGILKAAFAEVHQDMADFAQMMVDKNWIDCADSENRAQGAYCSGFPGVREPRVFMTYDGSMGNVLTLAHEIGHAYHSWVMRDIPLTETSYPMTLAETASIFAETLVRDYLLKISKSNEEKKMILWQELESAQSLMINIPARFEFEQRFVELRKTKNVTVPETKDLMVASQKYWYEETLSEYDEMFWASKLHFSMAGRSFYNYPYLFGYLFSLGIYAKKDSLGADFHSKYVELLRDTGRMTAEDLILKHFNEDITKKDFWLKSIRIVENSVEKFKKL
ncbi:MAG: M3 family oligoendopeptidase [Rhizobacter sp.]|nr:M3 family oligoendopeptidase [Bacteriovorax sp.]